MDKPSPTNPPRRVITLDDIAAEVLSQEINKDLSQMHVQEVKPQLMHWAVLGIIAGWIFLIIVASAILFLLTRSNIVFAPLTIAMGATPSLIKIIFRFLFWGPDDYRLERLRLTLKAKEKEWKYSRRSHSSRGEGFSIYNNYPFVLSCPHLLLVVKGFICTPQATQ